LKKPVSPLSLPGLSDSERNSDGLHPIGTVNKQSRKSADLLTHAGIPGIEGQSDATIYGYLIDYTEKFFDTAEA
jgi:hypothetical protein